LDASGASLAVKLQKHIYDIIISSDNFYYIFLTILQIYTTVSKFYSFDNHSSWPTAVSGLTAVGHGSSAIVVGHGG
jgi:hypothetical protein